MLALAETFGDFPAYLYRYNPLEGKLLLLSRTSDEETVPVTLDAVEGILGNILLSRRPFYNQTRKFGPPFGEFSSPVLVLSPLQYEKRVLGLLIVGKKAFPSRPELEFLSTKSVHFSLLLALEETGKENQELQKKSAVLEARLESAYERIRESDKLATLGQFAGGLAHEFNTPLGAVQTYAEYLQLFVKGEAEQDSIEGILTAVSHCREIVDHVLRLSRDRKQEFKPTSLRAVIADALLLTEPEMAKRKISVTLEAAADPMVSGNHTRLVQVIANLLNNARDSMTSLRLLPRKGAIKIKLHCNDDQSSVEVSDNGPGIPKKILGQVFHPFFTTKEVGQGIGLGLSICHSIVEEHSGSIEILSEEGQGTRAIVKIPMIK